MLTCGWFIDNVKDAEDLKKHLSQNITIEEVKELELFAKKYVTEEYGKYYMFNEEVRVNYLVLRLEVLDRIINIRKELNEVTR